MPASPSSKGSPKPLNVKGHKRCIQCGGCGKIKVGVDAVPAAVAAGAAGGESKSPKVWDTCPLCDGNGTVTAATIAKILGGGR